MENKDTISRTLIVAALLCVICAVLVASAAVALKPYQVANQVLDKKSNILIAAGMIDPNGDITKQEIEEVYKKVIVKAVDLSTGEFTDAVDAVNYDPIKAAKLPDMSEALTEDPAGLKRRENISLVYLIGSEEKPEKIVLPIRGYGLWSTLYGFIALEGDANTVAGFGFYQQGETPGLGGEVDNPKWKSLWKGKKVYKTGSDEAVLSVIKGVVDPNATPDAEYKVDGLAGATLTSRGVSNLVQYWLGENGFAKFLKKYQVNGEDNG